MIRKAVILVMVLGTCVVAVLWSTSYGTPDHRGGLIRAHSYTYYRNHEECYFLTSHSGWMRFGTIAMDSGFRLPPHEYIQLWFGPGGISDPSSKPRSGRRSAFEVRTARHLGGVLLTNNVPIICGNIMAIAIPHWILSAVLLAYPTASFIRGPIRRYRRRKHGLCLKCGYNLEGNTSGRCSECGTTT